jgi:uncharacterized protein YjgD (DUF1641 family)
MTNEDVILERLEHIEAKLEPLVESTKSFHELKQDFVPLLNTGVQQLIVELQDVESSVQLEDMLDLGKQALRSTRYFIYALKQMQNIIDFVTTVEPLLRSSIPQLINYLDELEQRGVLRIIKSMLDVRAKVADAYTPEDVEEIGNGFVAMLGLAKRMSDPNTIAFLDKFARLPGSVDLSSAKECGPVGLMSACWNKEVKQGLGILLEITKAMGKLSANGTDGTPIGESNSTS